MTWKEARKRMQSEQQQEIQDSKMEELKRRLAGKPFWSQYPKNKNHNHIGKRSNSIKTDCCFNFIIGLPEKGGKSYDLFDYEMMILRALEEPSYINNREPTEEERQQFDKRLLDVEGLPKLKQDSITNTTQQIKSERTESLIYPERVGHLLVLKSAGLGLTSFFLRYIGWLCLKDDKLKGQDIIIITGPRERLSIDLLTRLRQLFLPFNITFDTRENTMFLNGVRIRSMPSNNLAAARGIETLALAFLDESAFFGPDSQSEILDIVERYAGKSRAKIILCSTPNRPGDLMHTILNSSKKDFYKILKFDYTWGLGKIYTEEDIAIAKKSDSFQREYNLSFTTPEGNVFSYASIQRAIDLGKQYPLVINKDAPHVAGIDPAFGSSLFGISVLEYSDGIIKVVYTDQIEHASFDAMVYKLLEIKTMVGNLSNVFIDSSNTAYVEAAKQELGEDSNWENIHKKILWAKTNRLNIADQMVVVPVSFSQGGGATMLSHAKNILESEDPIIAINEKWQDLIVGLRGAISTNYKLNKSETPFPDLIDSFMLACKFFTLEK
jgi:hypothetical protein